MKFMNEWEIEDAVRRFESHPVLGPAALTLRNLADWADSHSDGWCYWPKPCRAAAKLQELLTGDGTWQYRETITETASVEQLKAALRPIKTFRTKHGADFEIVEVTA